MKKIEILLDDRTDEILSSLSAAHDGDKGQAVREALRAHDVMEAILDAVEDQNAASAIRQLQRSEMDFREGRFKTWDEVKRNAGL